MSLNDTDRQKLREVASRLNTAERAIADVRLLLGEIYAEAPETVSPQATIAKRSEPIAPPVVPTEKPSVSKVKAAMPAPLPPAVPWWQRESAVNKLMAVGGALITLVGIGFLIALAIEHGLLGPAGRLILALLFAVLFGCAAFLVERKQLSPAARTALALTSMHIGILSSAYMHFELHWIGTLIASILGTFMLALWLGISRYWRDERLAVLAGVTGVASLAPVWVAHPPSAVPLVAVPLMLFAVSYGMGWKNSRGTAGVLCLVTLFASAITIRDTSRTPLTDPPILAALIALCAVLFILRDRVPTSLSADRFVGLGLPILALAAGVVVRPKPYASLLALAILALLFVAGYIGVRVDSPVTAALRRPLAIITLCAFPVFYLAHWQISPAEGQGAMFERPLFVWLYFLVAAGVAWWLAQRPFLGTKPWVFWLLGALVISWELGRSVLTKSPLWLTDHRSIIQVAAICVFLGIALWQRQALAVFSNTAKVLFGLGGLELTAIVIVTVFTYTLEKAAGNSGMWLGYLIGHAAVSVLWMFLGAYVLLWARGLTESTSLGVGLVLCVAATIKLLFFDLGALEGIPRVLAFLISGIALLVIASLRTRRVSSTESSTSA